MERAERNTTSHERKGCPLLRGAIASKESFHLLFALEKKTSPGKHGGGEIHKMSSSITTSSFMSSWKRNCAEPQPRERERERERERDRQTDRQTDTHTHTHTRRATTGRALGKGQFCEPLCGIRFVHKKNTRCVLLESENTNNGLSEAVVPLWRELRQTLNHYAHQIATTSSYLCFRILRFVPGGVRSHICSYTSRQVHKNKNCRCLGRTINLYLQHTQLWGWPTGSPRYAPPGTSLCRILLRAWKEKYLQCVYICGNAGVLWNEVYLCVPVYSYCNCNSTLRATIVLWEVIRQLTIWSVFSAWAPRYPRCLPLL